MGFQICDLLLQFARIEFFHWRRLGSCRCCCCCCCCCCRSLFYRRRQVWDSCDWLFSFLLETAPSWFGGSGILGFERRNQLLHFTNLRLQPSYFRACFLLPNHNGLLLFSSRIRFERRKQILRLRQPIPQVALKILRANLSVKTVNVLCKFAKLCSLALDCLLVLDTFRLKGRDGGGQFLGFPLQKFDLVLTR